MPRRAQKLTKSTLDGLRKKAQEDPKFTSCVADAGQPGLYAWARRGKVDFVFAYRPPTGGRRTRIQIDHYGAITLDKAREIAQNMRGEVADRKDPRVERREEVRRALTDEELKALGEAMLEAEETGKVTAMKDGNQVERNGELVRASVNTTALLALRLIALTGMRRSELLGHENKARRGDREGLRWGDVDLEGGTLHLRDTKTANRRGSWARPW